MDGATWASGIVRGHCVRAAIRRQCLPKPNGHAVKSAEKPSTTSPKHLADALARLPQQASESVKATLENARRAGLDALVAACEQELRVRGSLTLNAADAAQAARVSAAVAGKSLQEVTEIAFREVPANREEVLIIRWIAQHPGTSFREVRAIHGKDDLSLVIGHLIYYRFGHYRHMLGDGAQSDLLLHRDSTAGSVRYTLRPEAIAAFGAIGLLEA